MAEAKDTALKSTANIYSGVSQFNTMQYFMDNKSKEIATALPVKVVGVEAGGAGASTGYVDVLPLTTFISGSNETVQPTTLYHLPYSRIQGGRAAIIADPIVGDKGLAIFAQADSSTVTAETTDPQQPGSKRHHSQSDGFYVGGFLNQPPSCYLELKQDNTAVLNAPAGIKINGNVEIQGELKTSGNATIGAINIQSHVHSGVQPGGGTTGAPQ